MDKTTIDGKPVSDLQASFKQGDLVDLMKVTRLVELAPILNDPQYVVFLNALMHYSIKVIGWVETRETSATNAARYRGALELALAFIDDAHIIDGQWHWVSEARSALTDTQPASGDAK